MYKSKGKQTFFMFLSFACEGLVGTFRLTSKVQVKKASVGVCGKGNYRTKRFDTLLSLHVRDSSLG